MSSLPIMAAGARGVMAELVPAIPGPIRHANNHGRGIAALLFALALAACSNGPMSLDAIPPDSGWQPQGVNAVNLRLMAADPADLVRGHGDPGTLGDEAVPAAERLLSGHSKSLPTSNVSDLTISDSGSSASSGQAPAATPGPPPTGSN